jgi:non-specific serine/threonine protein kinase
MLEIKRELVMTRLLTLTGPGGSGKTRLALEVARDLVEVYPDGVWLVELAPLTEGDLVPQEVAGALGVREQPGQPITDTLAEALRDKKTLLILDNCEHLADSVAPLLDALLDSCPGMRVLATSREILTIEGEAVRRVSSLSVPVTDRLPTTGELTRYDAVRLFLDRVHLRLPDFDLTAENSWAVAQVCRGLEGIPLAIELATARVGTLSVEQISERLQDPLSLLSAGGRTAVPRQQTLRATLNWSYELLDERERILFRRLSVFAGGWMLEAAEVVGAGGGIDEGEVLSLLSRLVDKSLAGAEADAMGAQRYRMLEPVRQYAREKLEESGETEAVLRSHVTFFLTLAERTKPELKGVRQEEWLGRLEQEHDNHRAALSWALEQGEAERVLRLSAALREFWYIRGHLSEGRRWLERGLAGGGTLPALARAKALNEAGWMALYQGELEPAIALLEESMGLFTELKNEPSVATSLFNLGHALLHQGDRGRLKALCQEAEALRRQFVDREAIAMLLLFLGMAILHEGNYEQAVAYLEESRTLFQKMGDTRRITMCHSYLWMATLAQGDQERAEALLKENLHLLQSLQRHP